MKMLKTAAALIITSVLFFSCTQDDTVNYGNPAYGTLIVKTLGTVLTSAKDAKTHLEELNPKFSFECTNEKANIKTEAGPYNVKESKNVIFQLPTGDWDIRINVTADNEGIIGFSNRHITIKAGQTSYLDEKVYTAVNGRAAAPKTEDSNFIINNGYRNVADPNWDKSPTLKVNVFQKLGTNGIVSSTGTYREGAHGTAKTLWDNNYLYVLVLVKNADLNLINGDEEHDSNSVEIFYKEKEGRIHQYRIDSNATKTYATITGPGKNPKSPLPADVELNLFTTGLPSDVSYAVVAKIPINISEKIGFDMQINGAPKTGTKRFSNAVWCKDIEVYNSGSLPESLYLVE